jgi:hypothetical protein
MVKSIDLSKYDVIYLSYDEPNADENYMQLLSYIPYAKRVHGVKGSDSAHKAAAKKSNTERFVVIDGDNFLIKKGFEKQTVSVSDNKINVDSSVFSWPSFNIINGLIYGNGGIKCWPTDLALKMKTHEAADPSNIKSQIEFCWDINYVPLDLCFSNIRNNSTPYQAWRAGFREGVKMSLEQGLRVKSFSQLASQNFNRLMIWMTVGADIENGIWAILGARQGCYLTHFTDWDYTQVRDFDYLDRHWKEQSKHLDPLAESIRLGNIIKTQTDIGDPFTVEQSKFFKRFNFNSKRQSPFVKITGVDNG